MALSLQEKANIADGIILLAGKPLSFWMQQKLIDYAQDWHSTIRPLNRQGSPPVVSDVYIENILLKVDEFADEVFRNRALHNITARLMADLIGDSSATISSINSATETQIEAFLDNNILEVFKRGAKLNRSDSDYLDSIL